VGVAASELGLYDFTSRAAKRHRSELRDLTGWHECSKTDLVKLVSHLVDVIWHDERREEQVRAELLRQMRVDLIEPPTAAQVTTIIRSALHRPDERAVAEFTKVRGKSGLLGRIAAASLGAPEGSVCAPGLAHGEAAFPGGAGVDAAGDHRFGGGVAGEGGDDEVAVWAYKVQARRSVAQAVYHPVRNGLQRVGQAPSGVEALDCFLKVVGLFWYVGGVFGECGASDLIAS
jgi:hypothetical protein